MKKWLVIGDPHARLSTLKEILQLASFIRAKAQELNVDAIMILGDLADDFARAHVLVLRTICQFFDTVLGAGYPVYYLVGNHDYINNQVFLEDYHLFNPFKKWENLHIIDYPVRVENVGMCPYVPIGRFHEAVQKIEDWRTCQAIFCHQEIVGSVLTHQGDKWDAAWPQLISGHIHDRCQMGNVLYPGAPTTIKHGEDPDKTVSYIEIDQHGINETRIDPGLPKKVTKTVNVSEVGNLSLDGNDHVRVKVTGSQSEIEAFKKSSKYGELAKKAKVIPDITDREIVKPKVRRRTFIDTLHEYCKEEPEEVRQVLHAVKKGGSDEAQADEV